MGGSYRIVDGDNMGLIANKLGFRDWRAIYDHPDNAEFRSSCPDPNMLVPGASLVVPDKPPQRHETRPTGEEHRFVLHRSGDVVRLRLRDPLGEPLRGWAYRLELADQSLDGQVPDTGELELRLTKPAANGLLTLTPPVLGGSAAEIEIDLMLGGLRPPDDAHGVQARLANLGLYFAEIDGDLDSRASAQALREAERLGIDDLAGTYGC
jgi:hypothetical protein